MSLPAAPLSCAEATAGDKHQTSGSVLNPLPLTYIPPEPTHLCLVSAIIIEY